MKLEKLKLADIKPYENNPRKNDDAVNAVAESIRQCTYITPIIVDEDHVIIAGHARYKALLALDITEVECLICDGLTEEQKKKYRYLDNKTGEKATWDLMKLEVELEGRKIDPTFYPVISGADEEDDWTDPKVWKKANPSLDITVGIDKVKAACESAKQNPGEENSFWQLRLNQWVKQAVRWMPMEKWDACSFPVDEDELEGRVCYGGLDLSSTTDLTAFALIFPPVDDEDKYIVLSYFWVPEETLDLRVKRDHVPYDVWERKGFLETTEGNVVHYGYIEKFIERLGERFYIREIAYDRWGATQLSQDLEGMGFTVVPFGQGQDGKGREAEAV